MIRHLSIVILILGFISCSNDKDIQIMGIMSLVAESTPNGEVSLESPGINITETDNSTNVTEGGNSDSYTISLASQPTSDVTITLTASSDITIDKTSLTYTTNNWSTEQTVNISAEDDDDTEDTHSATISHSVSSSDPNYNGYSVDDLTVRIEDNDYSSLKGSFQSGNVTINTPATSEVSITTVDPSKSYVYCNFRYTSSANYRVSTCQLNANGDKVEIKSGDTDSSNSYVNWYVVEFEDGASVQRGSETIPSADSSLSVTLDSINLEKSFVIVYSRTANSGFTGDERRTVMAELTDSTTLELSRNETGEEVYVEWQVIELNSTKVQSGTTTLSGTSTSTSISSVSESSTFLIFNTKASSDVDGYENRYYVGGTITDSSTITFSRGSNNGSVDISWFAVEMLDSTNIQKGSVSSSNQTTFTSTLSTSVDTSKTMILVSNTVGNSNTSSQDSGTFSSIFNSSTEIEFERANHENNTTTINWFTVEFN